MPNQTPVSKTKYAKFRKELLHVLEHFEHILPAQAPIRDFVHHNTLHGFEHLTFPEALKSANDLTGAYGYWPQAKYREKYAEGRISDADIEQSLLSEKELNADQLIFKVGDRSFFRKDIYRTTLLYPIKNITACQLKWQLDEAHALEKFQSNVPEHTRHDLLTLAKAYGLVSEEIALEQLWTSCINVLDLDVEQLHPEEFMDLSAEQAEKMLMDLSIQLYESKDKPLRDDEKAQQDQQHKAWETLESLLKTPAAKDKKHSLKSLIKTVTGVDVSDEIIARSQSKVDPLVRRLAWQQLDDLIGQVGTEITLRGLLKQITGVDIQTEISSYLQPYLANWMDQGFASWNAEDRTVGFYASWKKSALNDKSWVFNELSDWQEHIESLPDDSVDTIITELERMGVPQKQWAGYLERLALDLPGWSGMFYWRHNHPNYDGNTVSVNMMDYLAVRLITEHLYARRLCRKLWLLEANIAALRGYFRYQYAEFYVRYALNNQHLPEYVLGLSQQLIEQHSTQKNAEEEWQYLSHLIWTWQQTQTADKKQAYCLHHEAWKLFLLAQHLGLCSVDILQLKQSELDEIFACMDALDDEKSGFLLLKAYEHHYREELFAAITKNQGRGTWKTRQQRPEAQVIFCMDDREEGIRRHLEHHNPKIETLGAAAFFGVVMNWKGLDEKQAYELCPVVVKPEHEIAEIPAKGCEKAVHQHKQRHALRTKLNDFVHQESRRNIVSTAVITALASPLAVSRLIGKVFTPLLWGKAEKKLKRVFDKEVTTHIHTTAEEVLEGRSIENNQQGFTVEEQSDIVEGFLQNNGLLSGFSHFVVLMGHYSRNENNPHAAAYGCGACGGKYSGPNGRAFAAMANNAEVRNILFSRGIKIPDDTWFLGAEHDTCSEEIVWFDTDLIPEFLQASFKKLQADLYQASQHSAQERCRKLMSAPKDPSLKRAIKHMLGRGTDFSQARPELGHATIASGFIGRRYLSQGLFLDRRSFLISYDATIDPDGTFLERVLLTAGPVGAGINLEYYFSAVNNDKYGSSSKVVHNLSGLFGVMEGASSDLRTGLPQQMIEIHEPMRLQLMVEASTDVLTQIYLRQASIQQLVGNGWLLLSAKDPDSDAIHTFDPETGWHRWQCPDVSIPTVEKSADWYQGHRDHLSPALIKQRNLSSCQTGA